MKVLFVVLLLLITVGYAYLNSTLNINGTSTINNPTWDIHWDNIEVKTGSISATDPTIDINKTSVNYSVTLSTPGDYYEFTVDAVNAGTIDGMVSVVSSKLNGAEITTIPTYLEYKVSYEDGGDILPNHLLKAGLSQKYKIHVGYKKNINVSDLPNEIQTLNFSFTVTYVQADENAITPQPTNAMSGDYIVSTERMYVGQKLPNGLTLKTVSGVMEDWIELTGVTKPFYLKHTLNENNEIEETNLCFIKNGNEYCLKGYVQQDSEDSPYFLSYAKLIFDLFEAQNCNGDPNADGSPDYDPTYYPNPAFSFSCMNSGELSVEVQINGNLWADDGIDDWYCIFDSDGSSCCSDGDWTKCN